MVTNSNLSISARKKPSLSTWLFSYPSRRLGISSRVSVYIIAEGVYHHAERVYPRLDDIQACGLMIYNSFGIDDIHGLRRD